MADPATYRPAPGTIPTDPGVYRFLDERGRVIYVGKAKSLRARLSNYFQDLAGLAPRTQAMVTTAARVEWTVLDTEVEALQLEYAWIKEFDPRFNVKYRDDKSYPWLAVTLDEEYPRVQVMRGSKKKGTRYFGPYAHAWAIRETLDLLLRVFPIRSCSKGVFNRARSAGRPCLLGYIGKCDAPCVGRVSAEEHRRTVEDFCDFMAGHANRYLQRIDREMREASAELDFERAARLRDDLEAMRKALEKNAVVLGDGTDADVVALAEDELEIAVQVFHVRAGRIRGQRGWVADRSEDVDSGQLIERSLTTLYDNEDADGVPREILVSALPEDPGPLISLLQEKRGGRKLDLRVPQRGDKKDLLDTVTTNARKALELHKTKRAGDLTTRNRALEEIQQALGLDEAPLRIECYDVSNLQGSNVVASMVVFEDGLARKSDYRRFTIKARGSSANGSGEGADDVASIREVITRRFRRFLEESMEEDEPSSLIDPETGKQRKFAYAPGLVLVDGGPPQVAAAVGALDELGISDIPVAGLAKRLEEVWLPGQEDPVILPRTSEGLYLLQRIRDEAHRFAIAFHRKKRSKSMLESTLDEVPGLGEVRRKALLKKFGSLKRLREASVEDIAVVEGIGPRTAEAVAAAVAKPGESAPGDQAADQAGTGGRSVDAATGEIVDE